MPIPIPTGMNYTATLREDDVLRVEHCENCGQEYYYFMSIEAFGNASSALFLDNQGAKERALKEARRNLDAALATAVSDAPCPQCGHFQAKMFKVVQDKSAVGMWLFLGGIILFFLSAMVFLYSMTFRTNSAAPFTPEESAKQQWLWIIAGALGVSGIGSLYLGHVRNRRYDPNSQPLEARLQLAQQVSISKERLAELLKRSDSTSQLTGPIGEEGQGVPKPSTDIQAHTGHGLDEDHTEPGRATRRKN